MQRLLLWVAISLAGTAPAQSPCHGTALSGVVRDTTEAVIPAATVVVDGLTTQSGPDGRYRLPCVASGPHTLIATANGFARREVHLTLPRTALDLILQPEEVQTAVDVNADDAPPPSANGTGASQTISGARLQSLADDPDDLQRELQQLAAASGGSPANVTIAVDGFQGSSALPPKSSIAYIKVNPDQFSAEYRQPPFDGARVEIYTKPGQKVFHGALFTTNGSSWENARDPFSTSKAALGKQRYGFELTGPVTRHGTDFALTLEHRSINDFAVVNAYQPDGLGNAVHFSQNVPTPQRLWVGTARLDWQLGPKNTFISTYSANVNHQASRGVGGTTLAEAGYDSQRYEHMVRLSDITTASAHLMHEARVSFRWDGVATTPMSTAPQVQVAGAFTRGGASVGAQRKDELNIEVDDDAIWTTRKHTWKFGTQMMIYREQQQLTTNFNGTYLFGGGPGITGLQQYLANTPTAFTNVTGSPTVNFTELQDGLFLQDDWAVTKGVHIAYGLRYSIQNAPTMLNGITPRAGILWSPTAKGTWTLHAHGGLFLGGNDPGFYTEVRRLDGVERVSNLVYNPVYGNPLQGATPIHTIRRFSAPFTNLNWYAVNFGGTRSWKGWNASADYYIGRLWNDQRTENVNAPLNGQPNGPRPGPANVNILETQNSGQGKVTATFASVENHAFKRVQFFFGGVRVNLVDDTDDNPFFTPQSTYSNAGEFARRSNQSLWNIFGNSTVTLPGKLQWSTDMNGNGDTAYNITTGFDNNGDGNFNDRPQYAAPGQAGAVQTRYGLLIASGGTGVFPRNKGVLPWKFYVDMNVQRAFKLTHNPKADHQQTLTFNVRSSNILNHLNVTAVGSVLGSPQFGQAYAADNGRRVEAGARYSF